MSGSEERTKAMLREWGEETDSPAFFQQAEIVDTIINAQN